MRVFFLLLLFAPALLAQNRVSVEAEVRQVNKGQSVTVRKEIFLNADGRMVVRYVHPEEYYMITNTFGEARIYHPRTNEVMVVNDQLLSSRSELVFYFLTNQTEDFGLRSLGFSLANTRVEDNMIIRTYRPNDSRSNHSKVEIVHENHLPIYIAYYDTRNRMVEKLYFSDYQKLPFAAIPRRITGISYPTANDSIVSRTLYSNIKAGKDAVSPYFNFTIPPNAKQVDVSNLMQQQQQGRRR
jgi:hypothetical protein